MKDAGPSIGKKQFEASLEAINESARRVHECETPDVVLRLGVVLHQCDVLKAAAIAYAGEIELGRNLRPKKT